MQELIKLECYINVIYKNIEIKKIFYQPDLEIKKQIKELF